MTKINLPSKIVDERSGDFKDLLFHESKDWAWNITVGYRFNTESGETKTGEFIRTYFPPESIRAFRAFGANFATEAEFAREAESAQRALRANNADNADFADFASSAGITALADSAISASLASLANRAIDAEQWDGRTTNFETFNFQTDLGGGLGFVFNDSEENSFKIVGMDKILNIAQRPFLNSEVLSLVNECLPGILDLPDEVTFSLGALPVGHEITSFYNFNIPLLNRFVANGLSVDIDDADEEGADRSSFAFSATNNNGSGAGAYFADTMPRVSEQTVPLSMELI